MNWIFFLIFGSPGQFWLSLLHSEYIVYYVCRKESSLGYGQLPRYDSNNWYLGLTPEGWTILICNKTNSNNIDLDFRKLLKQSASKRNVNKKFFKIIYFNNSKNWINVFIFNLVCFCPFILLSENRLIYFEFYRLLINFYVIFFLNKIVIIGYAIKKNVIYRT